MGSYRDPSPPNSEKARTILVIEDELIMLRLLEKFFSRRGYRVLAAADGEQAVEVYCRHKSQVDAVFLDLGLPKVRGVDVVLKIRKENPNVRVVVASGYLDPAIKDKMYAAGIRDFFEKPYLLPEVVSTFDRLMAR